MKKNVMVSPLTGQWFPEDGQALREELEERIRGLSENRQSDVCAAIVPHAGYRFSGRVAAGVYLHIDFRKLKRIVVIGPSHYVHMHNQISLPEATHFRTPLGDVSVDLDFVARLRQCPFVISHPAAHRQEHSDQIQLPLIQTCLSADIPIVCAVCGAFDTTHLLSAAAALRELLDEQTLLVVSTDFTHYGPNYGYTPFTQDIERNIENLDLTVFDFFVRKDLRGFLNCLDATDATVCGRYPLALLLAMLPPDAKVVKTGYMTSGRMLGDWRNSVSYLGAFIKGSWRKRPAANVSDDATKPPDNGTLCKQDCERLLALVRTTIEHAFRENESVAKRSVPEDMTDGMKAIRGGFVTLHRDGDLRGCIGEILPNREIWKVVREQALNAAFHDPRFPPLTKAELPHVAIELSILTPPRPVDAWTAIEIGKHGMVLSKAGRSAVFLPQVAPEQGWGLEETLTHLSMKAGLPREAWRDGASFLVFEAQVVHETSTEQSPAR